MKNVITNNHGNGVVVWMYILHNEFGGFLGHVILTGDGYFFAVTDWGNFNFCWGSTGRDDLEPNASTNMQRVEAMAKVKEYGVHTFASIEPVIDLDDSLEMIKATLGFCDEYKIGLESGAKHNKKPITLDGIVQFVNDVQDVVAQKAPQAKIYWKDSITKKVAGLCQYSEQVVDAGYNIFAEGVK